MVAIPSPSLSLIQITMKQPTDTILRDVVAAGAVVPLIVFVEHGPTLDYHPHQRQTPHALPTAVSVVV